MGLGFRVWDIVSHITGVIALLIINLNWTFRGYLNVISNHEFT